MDSNKAFLEEAGLLELNISQLKDRLKSLKKAWINQKCPVKIDDVIDSNSGPLIKVDFIHINCEHKSWSAWGDLVDRPARGPHRSFWQQPMDMDE